MSAAPQSPSSIWQTAWLGPRPGLYRPECWGATSADIEVRELRLLLILPLVLREPHRLEEAVSALQAAGTDWLPLCDLSAHAAPVVPGKTSASGEQAARYAEFVYFHDFVQQILFKANAAGPGEPVRLFRHRRVKSARVTLPQDGESVEYDMSVERALLYLFGSGSAAFVAELRFPADRKVVPGNGPLRELTLADALRLADLIRRTYPPYFVVGDDNCEAGGVPTHFTWCDGQGKAAFPAEPAIDLDKAYDFTFHQTTPRTAPMLAHWRQILSPLTIAGYGATADTSPPEWRQVVDERIPLMSYVSLTGASSRWTQLPEAAGADQLRGLPSDQADLHMVNRGDWVRLCCADPPGSAALPYNPEFLATFETDACYDRFFPSEASNSSSRIMFTGYHMNLTGAGWFFDTLMVEHFRRHYFQMGLVVNMELASVLAISSRITEATKTYVAKRGAGEGEKRKAAGEFRKSMAQIERDFLELTHLYMFRGLSNQIQPMELYAKWRQQLNLDALYEDLKGELDAAMKVVQTDDEAERSERSMHLGQTANALALLATFGVLAGIVTGVLSINFLLTSELIAKLFGAVTQLSVPQEKAVDGLTLSGHVAVFCLVLSVASFLVCRTLTFVVPELKRALRVEDGERGSADGPASSQLARLHRVLMCIGWGAAVLSVGAIALACFGY